MDLFCHHYFSIFDRKQADPQVFPSFPRRPRKFSRPEVKIRDIGDREQVKWRDVWLSNCPVVSSRREFPWTVHARTSAHSHLSFYAYHSLMGLTLAEVIRCSVWVDNVDETRRKCTIEWTKTITQTKQCHSNRNPFHSMFSTTSCIDSVAQWS